jgi:hypothetical protein
MLPVCMIKRRNTGDTMPQSCRRLL